MKVFGAKRSGGYSGGVILVAADSLEEAVLTASKDPLFEWRFDWLDEDYKSHDGDLKYFHSCYYPLENWKEIDGLTWSGDKPVVIIEGGYTE